MWLFLTVLLLEILSGAEVDLFVPSFPEMQQLFHLNVFEIELTLAVNLVAHFMTCLVAGYLGDRYGRRPIIVLGLFIFLAGSLLCVYAPNYPVLLIGRFFQGVGISGPAVLAYLLISDSYPVERQQYLLGIANGVINCAVAFAPVVGSYVTLYFHWRGNFIALFLLALACLVMVLTSLPKKAVAPFASQAPFSLSEYKIIFQNPKTRYSILTFVFFILGYWVFIAISPILYMEGLGVDLKHFGFYQGAIAGVFSIGSFLSPLFLRMFDQEKCFKVSVWLNALCSVGILLLVLGQSQSPLLITVLMVIDSLTMVLPMVIFFPLIMNTIPEARGRISASITGGRLIGSAFFVQFAGYFYNGTFGSIGLILVGITLVGLFFYFKLLQTDPTFFKAAGSAL